jgi:hypothetical protein
MVKYTDQELEQLAQPTLEQFPDVNEVYATTDGNVFVSENLANLHATSKGRVLVIARKPNAVVDVKQTAADIISILESAKTLEEINPYASDKRKTVKDAYDKAFAEITELQSKLNESEGTNITEGSAEDDASKSE